MWDRTGFGYVGFDSYRTTGRVKKSTIDCDES